MIQFYDIDVDYADYLRGFEPHIPQFNYASNQKFLCGIVLDLNGIQYYAPVSHNQKTYPTSYPIRHTRTGVVLGTIRFNYMFPAPTRVVTRKDFQAVRAKDPHYYGLLVDELTACQADEDRIKKLAMRTYKWGANPKSPMYSHCCDFKKLESVYAQYKK